MRDPEASIADVIAFVPWAQMAGLRNRLAHEYDAVDMESVWLTVTRDLPTILTALGVD
jgi:uncharacterized protein with HEPN domain